MTRVKKAIVTGITGQDGAYLSKLLLDKGYFVYGCMRRSSVDNIWRIQELGVDKNPNFKILDFDLTDTGSIFRIIKETEPDEIYNLAGQSSVPHSFTTPSATAQINALGPLNLLEAIRVINPKIKFYQASTSEMFGKVQENPQRETTPFYPRSPYGIAKLYAHWMCTNYRESYNLFACSGILFNHESILRGEKFATRFTSIRCAQLKLGQIEAFSTGNLDAKRDWGFAGDYVEGMWLMLQQETPDDYILATGVTTSVRDFTLMSLRHAGFEPECVGVGIEEKIIDKNTKKVLVTIDPIYFRPTEVDYLLGDPTKARTKLGWTPKVELDQLCKDMFDMEIERLKKKV